MPDTMPALPPRRRVKRKKRRPVLKAMMIVLFLILLTGSAFAGFVYHKFNQTLNQVTVNPIPTSAAGGKNHPAAPAGQKPIAILLLGVDTRAATESLNTDVIMVAALNPKTKQATVVSLPRDTLMHPKGHDANKANAFYSIVKREDKTGYGQDIKTIFGNYFHVPLSYLTVVDFNALKDTVDELGGIQVNVDMNMCYKDSSDGTDIQLSKGPQKLNGTQTLGYVRYRKANCGNGQPSNDFDRNRRQEQVVAAILHRLKSFGGATRALGLFNVLGKNVKMDISKKELEDLIKTYIGISNRNIEYIHVQGVWRSPYTYVKADSLRQAQDALRKTLNLP